MDLQRLEKKIKDGKGTFSDVGKLAELSGKETARQIGEQLEEAFPKGQISEEDVRRIVSPLLRKNHEYVVEMTKLVINQMYKKAGIGLKAINPEYNIDRENELIKEISARSFKDELD